MLYVTRRRFLWTCVEHLNCTSKKPNFYFALLVPLDWIDILCVPKIFTVRFRAAIIKFPYVVSMFQMFITFMLLKSLLRPTCIVCSMWSWHFGISGKKITTTDRRHTPLIHFTPTIPPTETAILVQGGAVESGCVVNVYQYFGWMFLISATLYVINDRKCVTT